MISPHTPPGTALVVVWVINNAKDFLAMVNPAFHGLLRNALARGAKSCPLVVGQLVVLDSIENNFISVDGFSAKIVGVEGSYSLRCFKVAELPRSITSLLATKPVDHLEDA